MMMVVVVVSHGEIVSHGRFVVVVLLGPVSFQFSSVCFVQFCFVLFLVAIVNRESVHVRVCSHHERPDLLLLHKREGGRERVWLAWCVSRV